MIKRVTTIQQGKSKEFNTELAAVIKEYQDAGLNVEIQYRFNGVAHAALVIGHQQLGLILEGGSENE